jgi:hypothetical protein
MLIAANAQNPEFLYAVTPYASDAMLIYVVLLGVHDS